jgi:hypothetical protein
MLREASPVGSGAWVRQPPQEEEAARLGVTNEEDERMIGPEDVWKENPAPGSPASPDHGCRSRFRAFFVHFPPSFVEDKGNVEPRRPVYPG